MGSFQRRILAYLQRGWAILGFRGEPRRRQRSPLVLLGVLVVWSSLMGISLAQMGPVAPVGTVDVVPSNQQFGQELYIENCGSCHLAVPPAVLPTQTWRQLLNDPRHYGVEVPLLLNPTLSLVWNYLQAYSRPYPGDEVLPFKVENSRFFRALHPRVEVERPIQLTGCVTCHPGAADFDFRSLSSNWEDAP